jgi:hypothetical protein
MLLQDKLDALKAECLAKTPPKVTLVRQRVKALATPGNKPPPSGVTARAGPSRQALRRGPIVLVFYRGDGAPTATSTSARLSQPPTTYAASALRWSSSRSRRPTTVWRRRGAMSFRSRAWSTREGQGRARFRPALEGLRRTVCRRGGLPGRSRGLQRRSELDVDHAGPVRGGVRRDDRVRRHQRRLHAPRRPVRTDPGPRPPRRALAQLSARSHRLQKACPRVQTNRPGYSSVCVQVASMPHDCGVPRHVVECKGSSV